MERVVACESAEETSPLNPAGRAFMSQAGTQYAKRNAKAEVIRVTYFFHLESISGCFKIQPPTISMMTGATGVYSHELIRGREELLTNDF